MIDVWLVAVFAPGMMHSFLHTMDLLIASDGSPRADALLLSSPLDAHTHGATHDERTQQPFDSGRATEEAGGGMG